jgi:hypothetical protein
MPTGYTSDIYDGKDISGKEFLMLCARAFGATIMMRDDDLKTPIPENFEINSYYSTNLDKAKKELELYESMALNDAETLSKEEYNNNEVYRMNQIEKIMQMSKRYQTVLDFLLNWNPPTDDHDNLKKFAIEQIKDSMEFDCEVSYYSTPSKLLSGQEWLDEKIENLKDDVKRYEEDLEKEKDRVNGRNLWVKQLRESLL